MSQTADLSQLVQDQQVSDMTTSVLQPANTGEQNSEQQTQEPKSMKEKFSIQSFTIYTIFSLFSCYLLASLLTVHAWAPPPVTDNKTAITINNSNISTLFAQNMASIQFSLQYDQINNFSSDFFQQIRQNDKLQNIEIMINKDVTKELTEKLTSTVQNNTNVTVKILQANVVGFVINFGDVGFCYTGSTFKGALSDISNATCFTGLQLNNFMAYGDNQLIVQRHPVMLSDSQIYGSYNSIQTINSLLQNANKSIELWITNFNPQIGNDILTILLQNKQQNVALTLHANPANFTGNVYYQALTGVITPISNSNNVNYIVIDGKTKVFCNTITPQSNQSNVMLIQRFM